MRPSKLSQTQLEEIKKLYSEGKNSVELGRQFGVDHTTIIYHLGKTKKSRLQRRTRLYKKEINPTYRYNLNTLTKKSNSQYADYLRKEQERATRLKHLNKPVRNTFI